MNASSTSDHGSNGGTSISRREAIKRATRLLGVAISPSILAGVLRAQAIPTARSAKPVHLTALQFETAAAVAERILPKTDTPGATDVGVPAFIDLMFGEYMTGPEKRVFAAGLAAVDSASTAAHRTTFSRLTAVQQDDVLKRIAEASQNSEKTFFHQIKELTLLGYFTSETVGRTVLHYDPVPGRYDGCIPLSEVGNVSWTR
jgi:gluconate 2-dehydrogenase gamma chain